ncbi:unnamed protein product [Protopolystoma xenopodis]|uniref:PHD-type domain-containing protein n=1 Tax=Protopolystoma xenopodis TaxID=117903 RepID=A0A3S5CJG1_9PLAT|nr:unnamed protein product [Protopolystoma xenopodis]
MAFTLIVGPSEYIGCDACLDWFHFSCVGLSAECAARLADSWLCPSCLPTLSGTDKASPSKLPSSETPVCESPEVQSPVKCGRFKVEEDGAVKSDPGLQSTISKVPTTTSSNPSCEPETEADRPIVSKLEQIRAAEDNEEASEDDAIYCLCRTKYDASRAYIACDHCDEWYHVECVGLTPEQASAHTGVYTCPSCRRKLPPSACLDVGSKPSAVDDDYDVDSTAPATVAVLATSLLQNPKNCKEIVELTYETNEKEIAKDISEEPKTRINIELNVEGRGMTETTETCEDE